MIKFSAEQKNAEWRFAISDNDIGIAAEEVNSVLFCSSAYTTEKGVPGTESDWQFVRRLLNVKAEESGWKRPLQGSTTFKFTLLGARRNTLLRIRIFR